MGTGRQFGDKVRYACSAGYRLNGADESQCQASSTWSTTVPQCQGNVTRTGWELQEIQGSVVPMIEMMDWELSLRQL